MGVAEIRAALLTCAVPSRTVALSVASEAIVEQKQRIHRGERSPMPLLLVHASCTRSGRGGELLRIAMVSGALCAMSGLPNTLAAQPTLNLSSSCASCRIELDEVVALQAVWDDGALSPLPSSVSRFAGSFWVVVDPIGRRLEYFERSGRHIPPKTRVGDGPGELRRPMVAFAWLGDSSIVIDRAQGRLSVFDPTGKFRRSVPWLAGTFGRVMHTPNGTFVVATRINTRDGFGMPFHEFNSDGELLRSFGSKPDQKVVSSDDLPRHRTVSRSRVDGSFWSIETNAPRLRRWSKAGEVLEEWLLPMPGFRPFMGLQKDAPPGAEFESIEETADGLLVVVMAYRARRYLEAYGRDQVLDGRSGNEILSWGRFMDSRLLVLEPAQRRLLVTLDVDAFVYGSLGSGLYWTVKPGGDFDTVTVTRLQVRR